MSKVNNRCCPQSVLANLTETEEEIPVGHKQSSAIKFLILDLPGKTGKTKIAASLLLVLFLGLVVHEDQLYGMNFKKNQSTLNYLDQDSRVERVNP